MQKFLRYFGKEYSNINQAAILLGLFTFASQLLGLFRDRSIAHFIGPSPSLDAYYAAFRIPDLIFISVASLVSITVLIPFILTRMRDNKITPEAEKFLNDVFTSFLILMILVSVIVFFALPKLVHIIAPGFDREMQNMVIDLSRIMLISPILLGLSNLFGSITQLFKKFFIYSLSPIFYNVGIIIGILFLYPVFGIHGLAMGLVLGALMHFLIQFIAIYKFGFHPRLSFSINWIDIKKVFLTSVPRTLGLSFNNIAQISIVSFASFLISGSISIFTFAYNLQSVPVGVIGLSYAVAAFPMLTKSFTLNNMHDFKLHLRAGAKQIVFWSLPMMFLLIVLRAQIVRVVLGSGYFSWDNTRLVAASLAVFSLCIMSQGLTALFARAYYAGGNTRKPLIVNLFSSVSIILFAYLLIHLYTSQEFVRNFFESALKVRDVVGTEVIMLPLAYSLGTILNSILLWFFIKRDFMRNENFIMKTFLQSLTGSFVIGLVAYLSLNIFEGVFSNDTFYGVFLDGLISGILGIIAGGFTLYMLKNQELLTLLSIVKTKFWKDKNIVQDQESM